MLRAAREVSMIRSPATITTTHTMLGLLLMAALCCACSRAPSSPTQKGLLAVWGSSAKDVWAVGSDGTIVHFDGQALSLVPSGVTSTLQAVHGTGPNDVWMAGDDGRALHWDGHALTQAPIARDTTLLGEWARRPSDVWQVGIGIGDEVGVVCHWDGKAWRDDPVPGSASLWEVWGVNDELWLVGSSSKHLGLVEHVRGKQSDEIAFSGTTLRGVWGSAPNDVWVLPYNGPAQRWNGSAWSTPPWAACPGMLGLWGSGRNDVWAVGLSGAIAHFDGKAWSRAVSPTSDGLWSVWGSAPNDVWAVGGKGTVLRFDGKSWTKLQVSTR
jgi:hypothetical protein